MSDIILSKENIKELQEKTTNTTLSCDFVLHGKLTDSANDFLKDFDCVNVETVNGVDWIIVAELYDIRNSVEKPIPSMQSFLNTATNDMIVKVHACTIIGGNPISVYLGKRKVVSEKQVTSKSVVLFVL